MRIGSDGSWRQMPPDNSSTSSVESGQGAQQTNQTEETSGRSSSSSFFGRLCSRCSDGLSRVGAAISSAFYSLISSIRGLGQYITRDRTGSGDSSEKLAPRVSNHGTGGQYGSTSHTDSNKRDSGPPPFSPPPPPTNQRHGGPDQDPIYDVPRGVGSTSPPLPPHGKQDPIYDTPRSVGVVGAPIPMPQSGVSHSQEPIYDTPKKPGESSSSVGSSSSSSSS